MYPPEQARGFATPPTVVASISNGAPLRVLALGDSITYGYNDATGNSYRRDLACLLWTGGNPISMIGSVKNGDWDNNESDSFIYHTIDDILDAGTPELTRDTAKPNIVTLHAGTVNFVLGKNVTNAPDRLGNLIDFITSNNPSALLVVAQLIPNTKTNVSAYIDWYNGEIVPVVASRAREGKKVILTSMHGVTTKHVPDHSHPDEAGSRIMAQRFYEAIVEGSRRGLVSAAEDSFEDRGASSVSPSGKCNELRGDNEE
ncbi:SGNH hydrolase-type esterase domain-containing protein [Pyrenochaeta sp. MPI-SDFR-AT-0127]|nr:SGNH hydrolase-type esterase domain-containing protein [Pyrenochaeta sp. MPI-SDFR-AT-0127]